jgi:nucleotide-binding universal stress UspA family protein
MNEPRPQVVVAYDFSASGHAAFDRAIAIAKRAPWHVLHFVCVIDPRFPFPALPTKQVDVDYGNRVVAAITVEVATALEQQADVEFYVHAPISKKVAAEILKVAQQIDADLIIVGSKGVTGLERLLVGSNAERIVREAGCTVEVARPKKRTGASPSAHATF